jgi:hypothetical protein
LSDELDERLSVIRDALARGNPATAERLIAELEKDMKWLEGFEPPSSHLDETELAALPRPQRLTPIIELPESVEAAKAAGVPELVYQGGTVFTCENFPELIPDRPAPRGRPAPDVLPQAQEIGRGVAGPRPTAHPEPRHLHHTELWGDIELMRRHIEAAGGRIEEIAVNRLQRTGTAAAPTRVSQYTRPDLQVAVIDAQLKGRRIVIEYDKAPGTRAMAHARGVLAKDPDAIVILKIVGFESPQVPAPAAGAMRRPPGGANRGSMGSTSKTTTPYGISNPSVETRTADTPDLGQPAASADPIQAPDPNVQGQSVLIGPPGYEFAVSRDVLLILENQGIVPPGTVARARPAR